MPFKYYGIFSYIFATFCFHTTPFSTQVQRKINPYNLIYTFTVGIEHPSQPVPHRCISLWRKSRQYMSAEYPLPSHKDHISVTLKWKYYCLCILHLDSPIFLQCFVHALLKRQTVLLSNKLHSRLKHSIVLPVMDFKLGDLHLPTLGCSHKLHFKPCQDPVADLDLPRYTVIHVSTISYLTKMSTQKGWWRSFPCHRTGADTPVHWAANRGVTAVSFTLMWCNVQLLLQIQPLS